TSPDGSRGIHRRPDREDEPRGGELLARQGAAAGWAAGAADPAHGCPAMSRSLIEQWFPAATVGAESVRERGSTKAYPPINFLHVWWARRPLTASRAAVVGSLLPAWPSEAEVLSDERAAEIRSTLEAEFG